MEKMRHPIGCFKKPGVLGMTTHIRFSAMGRVATVFLKMDSQNDIPTRAFQELEKNLQITFSRLPVPKNSFRSDHPETVENLLYFKSNYAFPGSRYRFADIWDVAYFPVC